MFEHTPKHATNIKGSSDRSFGLVFAAVFSIIGFYPLLDESGTIRIWLIVFAGICLLLALFAPAVLTPFNRLWMKFGMALHRVVSPVALAIVFFLAVLPVGLLMRMLGKDSLRLRFNPDAESYWIKRDPPGPAGNSLHNQF